MSSERISIDRYHPYTTRLNSGYLVAKFLDYNVDSALEYLYYSESIRIVITLSNNKQYVIALSAQYIDRYTLRVSLCDVQTRQCQVVYDFFIFTIMKDNKICASNGKVSRCIDVEPSYPVYIGINVYPYADTTPSLTYEFEITKVEDILQYTTMQLIDILKAVDTLSTMFILINILTLITKLPTRLKRRRKNE